MNLTEIHSKFRLNGIAYTKDDLKALAYDLIKEGKPFEQAIGEFLSQWLDEHQVLEVKTSGSTGTPKKIILQKQQMVNSALATRDFFNLKQDDSALLCLSAGYIAGKMMLIRAMVIGLQIDYVEPVANPLSGSLKKYDFCAMVPLQLANSLKELGQVKKLIVGGAAISTELNNRIQSVSTVIYETYGMTETITHVAARRCNHLVSGSRSLKNSFKALPNVSFSKDERGCMLIKAPSVSGDTVVTNDVITLFSETEFSWLGRYDNVINSGGVKLVPEVIEAKLSTLIENRFFVAGMPDKKLGECLVLVVEGEIDAEKLQQQLNSASILERFEVPKNIYRLAKFLETETGKIRRNKNLQLIEE